MVLRFAGENDYDRTYAILQRLYTSNRRSVTLAVSADLHRLMRTKKGLKRSMQHILTMVPDVDEGSTVTDFLPAERARGITIQSAAITFHWPSRLERGAASNKSISVSSDKVQHTVNLIDTPGHADFTFEVIRSLRILDAAICILDGVAGVEAQTEKVWRQANGYKIPRLIYINKLDRDGAAFNRTVKEIASRLNTFPVLCHIPWWSNGKFIGLADVVELRALRWEEGGDGSVYQTLNLADLEKDEPAFAEELRKARIALIEALTEEDDQMVESFLEADEDWLAIKPDAVWQSLRRCLINNHQAITPVFAGASFRNIGVQPLLNAVNTLLPSPREAADPNISLDEMQTTLRNFVAGNVAMPQSSSQTHATSKKGKVQSSPLAQSIKNILALALAFKVVNDPKRGVLVYVRVYHGSITKGSLLYNTNLGNVERSPRLLRMYASEAVEIDDISEGQIGVIAGLKFARTGDTLLVYQGLGANKPLPKPIDTLQLRPIDVPPPLFFTSIEPNSLAEEKNLNDTIQLLLREDPSLSVSVDKESGQTHLSGMGELHLEIARDRLINDFRVKARMGTIEIAYRETPSTISDSMTRTFDREVAGKASQASCTASLSPYNPEDPTLSSPSATRTSQTITLPDANILHINHPTLTTSGQPLSDSTALPPHLPLHTITRSLQSGVLAALSRGPTHTLPLQSTLVSIPFNQTTDIHSTATPSALSAAARLAVTAALQNAANKAENNMMEPVMLATIAVPESDMGRVMQDLSSARGAQVLGLDSDSSDDSSASSNDGEPDDTNPPRLSPSKLSRVYAPPDPFASDTTSDGAVSIDAPRRIRARVPLKEMVGYLKHLRSLTGGRGTFVMSVDRYERMGGQRVKSAVSAMRGGYD